MEVQKINDLFNKYTITSETDAKGVITYVSQPFIDISGYDKEDLLGNTHRLIRHPDMPKEVFTDMWKTIKNKEIWRGEVKNRTKDGKYYWVDSVVFPLLDNKGEIIGYKSIRVDITAKKAADDLLDDLLGKDRLSM